MKRFRPSPALVVATLALFLAATGTSYAITGRFWLITSIHQIKPSVLRQIEGGTGASGVAGVPGANGSNGARGIQGPTGPAGPQGPQGVQGPAGTIASTVMIQASGTAVPQGELDLFPTCPAGTIVLSGGYVDGSSIYRSNTIQNNPTPSGWHVMLVDESNANITATAYAVCGRP